MSVDIRGVTQRNWLDRFEPACVARGRRYAEQGRATLLAIEGQILKARCQGSEGRDYRQSIRLQPRDTLWEVHGLCSCPVGYNCKHVVAALLTLERAHRRGDAPHAGEPEVEQIVRTDIEPRPHLLLNSHVRVHFDARKGRMTEQVQHRAALTFDYEGQHVHGKSGGDLLRFIAPGRQLRIRRDQEREAQYRQRLAELGFGIALRVSEALGEKDGEPYELPDTASWMQFTREGLPALRREGWHIHVLPDFHFNLTEVDSWYARLDEASDPHWFDLEMGIEVEGQRISLLPILLQAIRSKPWLLNSEAQDAADDEALFALLPGGQRVALPLSRLRPLLANLGELYFQDQPADLQRLRLPQADAARLQRLEAADGDMRWEGGERLRELAHRLNALGSQALPQPEGLQARLRPYQQQGVAWMQALGELGMGGVLADDMGLGKTLQTLAFILSEKNAGRLNAPALIVMPTSLIPNWLDEAARFTPQLKVLALQGPRRHQQFARLAEYDLLLTSYALLPRDAEQLGRQRLHLLILDEAQNIKNARSKAALALATFTARQRLCLTGTPLENHLGELWSLFHFLMPGWLGREQEFARHYRTPIEKHGDAERLALLRARVQPFLLRRTKEQVAPELPAKTEIVQWVQLTPAQRDRYEALRLAMDSKVREEIQRQGLARSQLVILEALLRLRQACCDLRLLDEGHGKPEHSAKLVATLEMLEELNAEGRRVLLFSQFTGMLELIEQELKRRHISYTTLTGSTKDRATPVREFQAGRHAVFLISLKAGGAGLNLTAADTVIHFDPWWNPAAEAQASDRAYRIGQDKPVFVYKLIARGSVEEKIQQLQRHKAQLAEGLLSGTDGGWQLSEEDVNTLLGPLQ
ncbi:MAG TPA: DEAD/DEAH box helicase [Pseudomonas sp.]|uniref:DEAD/DEAH box helicase n=1 Tax=Pseudomonas sp. TaxID=306 RepID=UPI002BB00EE2|nr:DEAD/DEAH box helicase [Pseudomonas sp.]HTO20417.1 DEAD/DEAH box helicase [Pseudomonas sp.]